MADFNWVFGENEERFSVSPVTAPSHVNSGLALQQVHALFLASLTVLIISIVLVFVSVRTGEAKLHKDIESAVQHEHIIRGENDMFALEDVLDPYASNAWRARQHSQFSQTSPPPPSGLQALVLRNDLAMVEVLSPDPVGGTEYRRETRWYRLIQDRWRRTEPQALFWGTSMDLQTEYFHFIYHQLDADSVEPLAGEIDALYESMLNDFGLSEQLSDRSFVIEVVMERTPALNPATRDWLRVSSPHLVSAPASRSGRDLLAHEIATWVASRVLYERSELSERVTSGFRLMLYCFGESAARQWSSPDPDYERMRREYLLQAMAKQEWLPLEQTNFLLFESENRQERRYQCSTVGDFIRTHYGSHRFADLLRASQQHVNWRDVVENGLGVTYLDFVREWQQFVSNEYGQ